MALRDQVKRTAASAASVVRRGTRRGAHEAHVRKLQWEIDRHKAALGKSLYPLIETGAIQVDLPEVHEELARIRALYEQLRALQEQRD